MRQIITRVDDELAEAVKRHARRSGESVNAFVNRLLRAEVAGPNAAPESPRQLWKVAALADGRLVHRQATKRAARGDAKLPRITTPAGYASTLVSAERDER